MSFLFGNNLTAEQRLSKAVVSIMGNPKYTALAQVLVIGNRTVNEIPTACTNGRDEVYGRKFIEGLTDPELRFLVLHETRHKLYRHLHVWAHLYKEDPDLANKACDYVINLQIQDENKDGFATMPMKDGLPVGLIDEKYRGMDTAQVFNRLKQDKQNQPPQGQGQPQQGQGQPQQGQPSQPNDNGLDSHDWEGAQEMTEDDKKELAREVDEAIRQGALTAGKLGHDAPRDLQELLQPQVDWREVLRDYITETCAGKDYGTWARPNRRFMGAGVYMPSTLSEQVGELVIAIDTSGSIGGPELVAFLSEVQGIAEAVKPEAVRILYWDTAVRGDERYETDDLEKIAKSTKPRGGGGTSIKCVNKYMADNLINAQAVIVLTDGYLGGQWGQWQLPVLWCIAGGASVSPPGRVVNINI
jgi:predicted metal-dependent peptidase